MSFLTNRVSSYSRLIKIEHTLFSLPMLFSGALLGARGWPSLEILGLIVLIGFAARTFAMVMNRLIDRRIDAKNPRTAGRELPARTVSVREAIVISLLSLFAYLYLAHGFGELCFLLSPIPLLLFVAYPYLKRFTSLAHFGVGAALAMAPLGGYMAVTRALPFAPDILALGIFVFCWVSGFDIIYATLDEQFDRDSGLFSLPARLGREKALRISGLLHVFSFLALAAVALQGAPGTAALAILALTGLFLFLEHRFAHNVDLAFFGGNVVVGFLVLVLVHLVAAHA